MLGFEEGPLGQTTCDNTVYVFTPKREKGRRVNNKGLLIMGNIDKSINLIKFFNTFVEISPLTGLYQIQ